MEVSESRPFTDCRVTILRSAAVAETAERSRKKIEASARGDSVMGQAPVPILYFDDHRRTIPQAAPDDVEGSGMQRGPTCMLQSRQRSILAYSRRLTIV